MRILLKTLPVSLLASLSAPLWAHSGHGADSATLHTFEHMLFTVGAVAVVVVLACGYVRRSSRRQQPQRSERKPD